MRFHSTRGSSPSLSFSQAVDRGLAPDGGLYVPERLPTIDPSAFDGVEQAADIAAVMLAPFFVGDEDEHVRLCIACKEIMIERVPLVESEEEEGTRGEKKQKFPQVAQVNR